MAGLSFFDKWTDKDSEIAIAEAKERVDAGEKLLTTEDSDEKWQALVRLGYASRIPRGRGYIYQETNGLDDDRRKAAMTVEQMTRFMNRD